MEYKPAKTIAWESQSEEHFTGEAWFGPWSRVSKEGLNALNVLFAPGSRTDWHTHVEGQVLYCIGGAGLVQTDAAETVEMSPGDVVYSPPGERHWHGATPHKHFEQLSLTTGGDTEWFPEKVSDEDYHRR